MVILAFHFSPSHEVGAKRATALAEDLRAHGNPVAIVSAFEGLPMADDRSPGWLKLDGYRVERIIDRKGWGIRFLVALKRAAQRLLPTRAAATNWSNRAGTHISAAQRRFSPRWLHHKLFSVIHSVDDKKRWALFAARRIVAFASQTPVSLVIVSAPPVSSLFGAVIAARRLGVPVIIDLRDPLYDERVTKTHTPGSFDLWCRRTLERFVVRRAAAIVTTSPSFRDVLRARFPRDGARVLCIPNGFDGTPLAVRSDTGHRLVMVYAGALYMNRNPFPLLEAIDHLLRQGELDPVRLEFVLAGECERYAGMDLRQWLVGRPSAQVVTILPRISSEELARLYERATVLLNFAEGQMMQVPAKTFELLSLGREVLIFCEPDSDTAKVVQGLAGVSCICSSDAPALYSMIRALYHRHVQEGRLCAPAHKDIWRYSRTAQNERFRVLIRRVRDGKLPDVAQ